MPELSPLPARLPGVAYWFSEENSFAFGLQVDIAAMQPLGLDAEALFERFSHRLIAEYRRLKAHADAHRANEGAYRVDPDEDEPIAIQMVCDDVFSLQIVPVAIESAAFAQALHPVLREFVALFGESKFAEFRR